jgi:hypothetical protein
MCRRHPRAQSVPSAFRSCAKSAHFRYKEIMSFVRCMAFAMLAAASLAAVAQDDTPPRIAADPADPAGAAAPLSYASAFRNYLKASGQEEIPDNAWRAANDEVRRLGGHAGQAQARAPEPTSSTPPSAPPGHGHHHGAHPGSGENS